jgi:hypothetical protein
MKPEWAWLIAGLVIGALAAHYFTVNAKVAVTP